MSLKDRYWEKRQLLSSTFQVLFTEQNGETGARNSLINLESKLLITAFWTPYRAYHFLVLIPSKESFY